MRRTFSIAALVSMLGAITLLGAPAASAQTGYPPGPCTPLTGAQDAGSHLVGQSFSTTLEPVCVFTPGSNVNIVVNGQVVGTKVANANGFVTVNITVGPSCGTVRLQVNDPVTVNGTLGANNIVATGPSSVARANVTQTAVFRVLCPSAAGVAKPVRGRVAFTGANILRWSAVAIALVLLGSVLVVANRRRQAARG